MPDPADEPQFISADVQDVLDAVSDAVWSTAHPLPPAVLDAWTTYLASREMADGN